MESTSTSSFSTANHTVRRRWQLGQQLIHSSLPDSPNPLRAPPVSLLGPSNDNSISSDHAGSRTSLSDSTEWAQHVPVLALPQLEFRILTSKPTSADADNVARFWIIVDITCGLHQSNRGKSFQGEQSLGDYFVNNPGFLERIVLAPTPLPKFRILATLGNTIRSTLNPFEKMTVIFQVALEPGLSLNAGSSSVKTRSRPLAFSMQGRPTSHVLIDQLIHKLKPAPHHRPGPENATEEVLKVNVGYKHSCLPFGHRTTFEETFSAARGAILAQKFHSPTKHVQKPQRPHDQQNENTAMTLEHGQRLLESILRVVDPVSDINFEIPGVVHNLYVSTTAAIKIIDDFLSATKSLHDLDEEGMNRLKRIQVQYEMLSTPDDLATPVKSKATLQRRNPFDRPKREGQTDSRLETRGLYPGGTVSEPARRNAVEIQREELDVDQGLSDITNRNRHREDMLLRSTDRPMWLDGVIDRENRTAMPPPLFSPRKRPSALKMAEWKYERQASSMQDLTNLPTGEVNIGSAKFYEVEVEQVARRVFGGSNAGLSSGHVQIEMKNEERAGVGHGDGNHDGDGVDKAKQIWAKMRISSEGSVASGDSTLVNNGGETSEDGDGDGSDDEDNSRVRELSLIGSPWLA